MAVEKFVLIESKSLGRLSGPLLKRWQVLSARKDRLERAEAKLKADFEAFELRVLEATADKFTTTGHESFKLENNGHLTQMFCRCVECQAGLHGMSVIATVESMIKANLIPRDQIAAVRSHTYNNVVGPKEREIFS